MKLDPHKPTLVQVGDAFVDPTDVAAIVKVREREDLYVVRLKSQPNTEHPLWVRGEHNIAVLLDSFNVIVAD